MSRYSSNFQVTQLLDNTRLQKLSTLKSNFNDFGNFTYKDHVTRKQYNVDNLKTNSTASIHQFKQNSTHPIITNYINKTPHLSNSNSQNHSLASINNTKNSSTKNLSPSQKNLSKYYKNKSQDQLQIKKWQLSHFLQQLEMMNRIKNNRNYIVSGNQKAQKRKSIILLSSQLPQINPNPNPKLSKTHSKTHSKTNIDSLKQQIRKQVNTINNELFRQYLTNKQPYRTVFGQLNQASYKGALNSNKIKQIKQKIKQVTKQMQTNDQNKKVDLNVKKYQLQNKQKQKFDNYFNNIWKQLNQDIHLKIRHQASFNWKYGKKSNIQKIIENYGDQLMLEDKKN